METIQVVEEKQAEEEVCKKVEVQAGAVETPPVAVH